MQYKKHEEFIIMGMNQGIRKHKWQKNRLSETKMWD